LVSFASAARILEEVGQVDISDSSVWRLVWKWGEGFQGQEKEKVEKSEGVFPGRREVQEETPSRRMGAAMDGTMIHIRGEGWKELKAGCVFEVKKGSVFDERTGEWEEVGQARSNSYAGHLGGPEAFGKLLWAEARQREWMEAGRTQVIGDGAPWIWNLAGEHFYSSEQVVDWYHGVQHLAEAAKLLHGEGSPAAHRWLHQQETLLYQGGAGEIAKALRKTALERSDIAEGLWREAAYFEHNKRRMDYLEMRADGWVIGSGMVESGGKQFRERFAGPGMRWSRAGAERLLPIRAEIMSKRFVQSWKSVYNSPPN
jgi:hypothetical protein